MLSSRPLRVVAWSTGGLALLLLLIGRFVPPLINKALHDAILEQVVWRPDSPPAVDARFRGLPDPAAPADYFRVWMWNLTNLREVRQGAKPNMAQVGPLTYLKYRVKLEPRWDRRGRVSVKEWDYHVFQPHLSAASPNDTITTLNLPLLGVLELLHAYGDVLPAVRTLVDVLLGVLSGWRDEHVDGLFVRRTAGELLWGYEDLLLQRLQLLLGRTFVPSPTVQLLQNDTSAEQVLAKHAPSVIDTGWRPAGADGEAEPPAEAEAESQSALALRSARAAVHEEAEAQAEAAGGSVETRSAGGRRGGALLRSRSRSRYDQASIWNMEAVEGWREVSSWGPNCSERVRGTDAFQFAPGVTRAAPLRVWITELFRSAELLYKEDVEVHGVRLLRFEPDPAESEPDVCHRQRIRGLLNITTPAAVGPTGNGSSPAAHGVPLYMSLPHYCLVDESVPAALEGVSCDLGLHKTFIDVEPSTGITMRAAKRLQLSSELTDSARATLEPRIPAAVILPVFWAEEASAITPEIAAAFASSVYGAQRLAARVARWSYPVAAVALALSAATTLAAAAAAQRRRPGATSSARGAGPSGAQRAGAGSSSSASRHATAAPLLGTSPTAPENEGLAQEGAHGDRAPGDGGAADPDGKGRGPIAAGGLAAGGAGGGLEGGLEPAGIVGRRETPPGGALGALPGLPADALGMAGGGGGLTGDMA